MLRKNAIKRICAYQDRVCFGVMGKRIHYSLYSKPYDRQHLELNVSHGK